MSEFINNREMRQKTIKEIIKKLHEGKTVEEVKAQFEEAFQGVSASEISAAESALIADGLPVEEVQKLCDVHAAVFKGSIEEIHQPADPSLIPGHPVNVLVRENKKISHIIDREIRPFLSLTKLDDQEEFKKLMEGMDKLKDLAIHYQKKENLLQIENLMIDLNSHEVFLDGESLVLPNKEFELLVFLAKSPNIVFSKDQLFEKIWGLDAIGEISTVTVHINRIREKIEKDSANPKFIETVWGSGYRFRKY